jgi:hypothetical protein
MGRRWRATLLEIDGGMLALVEKDKEDKKANVFFGMEERKF